jgi:hypothetical protein
VITESCGRCDALMFLFISGEFFNFNNVTIQVAVEGNDFQDIVVSLKKEAYANIVFQTMDMMRVLSADKRVTHVLKLDDDSFVRPHQLFDLVAGYHRRHHKVEFLAGNIEFVSSPIRDPNSKWYVSVEEWSKESYPVWAHGAGYVLTSKLSRNIGAGIPYLINDGKVLPNEDVAVGSWVEYQSKVFHMYVKYFHDLR